MRPSSEPSSAASAGLSLAGSQARSSSRAPSTGRVRSSLAAEDPAPPDGQREHRRGDVEQPLAEPVEVQSLRFHRRGAPMSHLRAECLGGPRPRGRAALGHGLLPEQREPLAAESRARGELDQRHRARPRPRMAVTSELRIVRSRAMPRSVLSSSIRSTPSVHGERTGFEQAIHRTRRVALDGRR